jgi:hypothetical protein
VARKKDRKAQSLYVGSFSPFCKNGHLQNPARSDASRQQLFYSVITSRSESQDFTSVWVVGEEISHCFAKGTKTACQTVSFFFF